MTKKYNDDLNLEIELEMLSAFSQLAKTFKGKTGIENQFSLVVVNANIAEYVLYLLIFILSQEVIQTSRGSKVKLRNISAEGKLNQAKIETLKYFDFKNRERIIELLQKIFKCRNDVFHNLIRAHSKKLDITQAINDIHTHTDELRLLVVETLSDVWSNK